MRVLVATDAWHPQVNGVVRTLMSLAESARRRGATIEFLTPEGFPSVALPTYPHAALCPADAPRDRPAHRKGASRTPSTSPPKGRSGTWRDATASSRGCPSPRATRRAFPNTSPRALPVPEAWSYAVLRRFHAAAAVTMVSTASLMAELAAPRLRASRPVDAGGGYRALPARRAIDLALPRPLFLSVGRVAIEKNLEAFLALDLPGSKVVIGEGPQLAGCAAASRTPRSWAIGGRDAGGASGRGGRVRVPEPDRYLRHRPARGAGLRRAGRRLSR